MKNRELKKIQTRKTLVSKAHSLFNEFGVSNIGMRKLAEESGLGLGTYYNYFKNKDEIIFSISHSIFLNSFEGVGRCKGKDVSEKLSELVIKVLDSMSEDVEIILYLVQIISNPEHYADDESEGRIFNEAHISNYSKLVKDIIGGNIINIDEDDFARLAWHHLMIFLYMWFMDSSKNKLHTKKFIKTTNKALCFGVVG
jgi:AcrR family transcriptional regulator